MIIIAFVLACIVALSVSFQPRGSYHNLELGHFHLICKLEMK